MPFHLYFTPSFKRALKALGYQEREITGIILEALEVYYLANCNLEKARKISPRFFYKQLRKPYYEAGVESNIRVVIRREENTCYLILVGNHDQIKRLLNSL